MTQFATYFLCCQQFNINEFRLDWAHRDGFECQRSGFIKIIFNGGRHNLDNIFNAYPELAVFVITGL